MLGLEVRVGPRRVFNAGRDAPTTFTGRLDHKGRVVLPEGVRLKLGLHPGDLLVFNLTTIGVTAKKNAAWVTKAVLEEVTERPTSR